MYNFLYNPILQPLADTLSDLADTYDDAGLHEYLHTRDYMSFSMAKIASKNSGWGWERSEAMDERVMGTRGGVRKGSHHGSHEGSDRDGGWGSAWALYGGVHG